MLAAMAAGGGRKFCGLGAGILGGGRGTGSLFMFPGNQKYANVEEMFRRRGSMIGLLCNAPCFNQEHQIK